MDSYFLTCKITKLHLLIPHIRHSHNTSLEVKKKNICYHTKWTDMETGKESPSIKSGR